MHDLSDLLIGSGDESSIVAYRRGQPLLRSQLRHDVAHNAARLAALNCRRGLVITEDTYWCAVAMLALFQIGADVILPQNTTTGASNAIQAEWDLIVTDQPADAATSVFELGAGVGRPMELKAVDAKACRLSLFTSGSTGEPKRVDKTLALMQREAVAIEQVLGASVPKDGRIVGTVTHQHLFGLSFKLFWPLCTGRPFEAAVHEFWEELLAEDLGHAAVVVSPAHLKRLGDLELATNHVPPSCLLSAGAELGDDSAATAQKAFHAPLCEIYGSTETGMIGWRWRSEANEPWSAAPGVVLDIGADGALLLRSPFASGDAWVRTEDRAEQVPGGFRLIGRADRIVKIEGKRVSLPEIEAALAGSPLIAAVALIALGDDELVLAAVVVPSVAGSAELARLGAFRFGRLLRQCLASRHEAAAMPRRWRFVEELPVGPLGKIRQAALRSLFNQGKTEPDLLAMRRNGDALELDLFNAPELLQLDGHFPNMPIVPGVAQIDWVVKFAARHLDLPLESAQDYQVKFHRLTLPETTVTLALTHDRDRQRLNFSYRRADVVLTSGVIRLAPT
ncbi:MAG: acyl-CoA synthetase [Proteobacteria bacterium]|nr:acyl-CoA synthetase [Pseudomonadota bacterium]